MQSVVDASGTASGDTGMSYANSVYTLSDCRLDEINFNQLIRLNQPCLVKGVLATSPLVKAGGHSIDQVREYLNSHYSGRPLIAYQTGATEKGRFFYDDDLERMNFSTGFIGLQQFFDALKKLAMNKNSASIYVGSADIEQFFPEMLKDNLALNDQKPAGFSPKAGIWMGNQTTAVTHFDTANNIAACMVGHRRFTLFPPSQTENLYPGPLEPTPGGQIVSMVDINTPNFVTYPKAEEALRQAVVVDLEPGDVLVYPALWWHQVEALDDVNIMLNYWWNELPEFVDDPMSTLLHGMLSLRHRSNEEKAAWLALFKFYIFDEADNATEHLPAQHKGLLAEPNEKTVRRLRSKVLQGINR